MSKAQLGGVAVLFIVLMRLAAGYHFFSEGMKKFEPGYEKVTEGFLRGATGPWADRFHAMAPGPHRVHELLAVPRKWDSLSPEQRQERSEWQGKYSAYLSEIRKKNAQIEKANEENGTSDPLELVNPQFAPHAPYSPWGEQISEDWAAQLHAFSSQASLDDEAQDQAERVYLGAKIKLEAYLTDVAGEIEDFQHELWRLQELKNEVNNEGGSLPYIDDRIAKQQADAKVAPRPWIAEVAAIEARYHCELRDLADSGDPEKLNDALNPPTELTKVNTMVTWVVVGSGALLFLGLFTRVAAVAAAGFLLSVIATQPPWVYGANTQYFFYQLFEVAGLLTLAAVGAGRWLGVDGLLGACCCRGGRCSDQAPAA